jgi:hypothetical protein
MTRQVCFVTLALGRSYRAMASTLAEDLARHAPGTLLVVGADIPADFAGRANVRAYPHERRGLFRCINDKRFPISIALRNHADTAIFLDADTRIRQTLPTHFAIQTPISTIWAPNLAEQMAKWLPPRERAFVKSAALSFGVVPETVPFVWDNLFAISRDDGRESVFLATWGLLTTLFDFQGVSITDGYCMAIAAAATGWVPAEKGLQEIENARVHAEASHADHAAGMVAGIWRRAAEWWRWRRFRRQVLYQIRRGKAPHDLES